MLLGLLASSIALATYLRTLAPTIMWYDMGELTTVAYVLGIPHNTGYPLYVLLGKLFTFLPFSNVAYRVNLMSAVFASLTVLLTYLISMRVARSTAAAFLAALTLAFSSTLWANATWAETYPLNTFFMALITFLTLRWREGGGGWLLRLASYSMGLSLCNHRLAVLLVPGAAYLVLSSENRPRGKEWLWLALLFLAGLSLYLYLPIRGSQAPPLNWAQPAVWETYVSMFLTGSTPRDYWDFAFWERWGLPAPFMAWEFTLPGLAVIGVGLARAFRRNLPFAIYSLSIVLLTWLLTLMYQIHNIFNYLLPAYLMMALWLALGAEAIIGWGGHVLAGRWGGMGAWRPKRGEALMACALALLPLFLFTRNFPTLDRSQDYSAEDFARTTLVRLPPRAVVVTDSWTAAPFWYLQWVEGLRLDVFVSPVFAVPGEDPISFIRQQLGERGNVYVAEGLRGNLEEVRRHYYLWPVLLNGIECMVTNSLPRPEVKDYLLSRRSLFKVHQEQPSLVVTEVPVEAQKQMVLSDALTLVGFSANMESVAPGEVIQLQYYWRAEAPVHERLNVSVIFVNEEGAVAERFGHPLWLHNHALGSGVYPPERWKVGGIVKEEYHALVPRALSPGRYLVRARLYPASAPSPSPFLGEPQIIGTFRVSP